MNAAIDGWTAGTWTIDGVHSEVGFQARHLGISKVKGTFEKFEGTITTGETVEESTVTATVEVGSVNTNQEQRDQHLRTSDFFLADEHPTFSFTSTSITPNGDTFTVAGDLTLRGVTKPVEFQVEFGGFTTDGNGTKKLGLEGEATINRQDFGVSWNAPTEAGGVMLGDNVKITLDLQADLQA
ncbi:MAG: YceI family protein [Pseudoclavibacter sp.]